MERKVLIIAFLLIFKFNFAQRGTSASRPIQVQESNTTLSQSRENRELTLSDILNAINNNQKIPTGKSKNRNDVRIDTESKNITTSLLKSKVTNINKPITQQSESSQLVTSLSLFKKPYSKLTTSEKEILKKKQLEFYSNQNREKVTEKDKIILENNSNKPITSMSLFGKTYNELSESEKEILKNKKNQTNN